jgi:hypothetical protein
MKNLRAFAPFLVIFSTIAGAQVSSPYELPEAGPIVKNYMSENDPGKKKAIADKMLKECPFRKTNSELETLTTEAVNLQLSANVPNSMFNQCSTQLKSFNDSISRSAELKNKIDQATLTNKTLTAEEQAEIKKEIEITQMAANSFNNLLQLGCEFKNTSSEISNIGFRLINVLDASSMVLLANPAHALVASSAAITGRLVISLSQWLFDRPNQNQLLTKETQDSKRFINDLCLFRTLAYKYDELYVDPFEDPNIALLERQVEKNKATAAANELRQCTSTNLSEPIAGLASFSKELLTIVDTNSTQKQCLNLVSRFNSEGSPKVGNPIKNLAQSYGCPDPGPEASTHVRAYCRSFESIKELCSGDYFEKCEDPEFQKKLNAKFTSLSEILFQSAQETTKQNTPKPKDDDLQRLRIAEQEEKIAIQRYASLQAILEDSPMTHVNSSKSMMSLGRTVLGDRFDVFAKDTFKSIEKNLEEADDILSPLPRRMEKAKKLRSPAEQARAVSDVCTKASQARQQLATVYHSSVGMTDICFVMKGQGIPPLKSQSLNFDNYSSGEKRTLGIFKTESYLSKRCEKISSRVSEELNKVKKMVLKLNELNCRNR